VLPSTPPAFAAHASRCAGIVRAADAARTLRRKPLRALENLLGLVDARVRGAGALPGDGAPPGDGADARSWVCMGSSGLNTRSVCRVVAVGWEEREAEMVRRAVPRRTFSTNSWLRLLR
jgi:hypothetical protein